MFVVVNFILILILWLSEFRAEPALTKLAWCCLNRDKENSLLFCVRLSFLASCVCNLHQSNNLRPLKLLLRSTACRSIQYINTIAASQELLALYSPLSLYSLSYLAHPQRRLSDKSVTKYTNKSCQEEERN